MTNTTATTSSEKEPGSFLTGFTLGLLAGAVAHFLFTTDRGERVLKSLQEEWSHAQKELHKKKTTEKASEVVQEVTISIRDLAKKAIKHFTDQVADSSKKSKPVSTKKSKTAVKSKKSSKNTFSGV
jgi:gas vesicle protein